MSVFRNASEPASPEVLPTGKTSDFQANVEVEVPYLDYQVQKGHPYSVDYFELGDLWNHPEGGFSDEIADIEEYFNDRILSGEMANSTTAIKNRLREIEKVNNLKGEERAVIKIGTIRAYVNFLKETDDIKKNIKRYGNR